MSQEQIEQELKNSRLKINVLFAVDPEEYLKVIIEPGFSNDLTEDEQAKAAGLMAFVTGLIHESQGDFSHFQQKGIELAQQQAEVEVGPVRDDKQLDLQFMEVKGRA